MKARQGARTLASYSALCAANHALLLLAASAFKNLKVAGVK